MHEPPFAAVWFDCDSTLAAIEGVDELLRFVPQALRADIAGLTRDAMEGKRPLAEVYETRLSLLAPRRELLAEVGRFYVAHVVPDAAAVVRALRWLGKQVGIASGGLLPPVAMLADHLGIEPANVRAVPISFHDDGSYRDFDRSSPLWRNGGKIDVLRALPAHHRPVVFVGDGVTDLETQGTADLFVGYGGVVERPKVAAEAERYFATPGLAPLLGIVLTQEELARLAAEPQFRDLVQRSAG